MASGGIVLVTGVGQGFGRSVALGWGRAGYDVVCADRDVELAARTAAEVEEVECVMERGCESVDEYHVECAADIELPTDE